MGAKPKQAGKKEGGWGEGIFASLLPFPFRLRKGKAEGGFGAPQHQSKARCGVKIRAFPLRNQIEASSATCPNTWRAEHRRKILFSLKEEEIGRAQNEKSKEYFSVVWRACRAVAGLASLLGVLLKKSSNINQKTPPIFTFCEIVRNSLGAKRLGMVFFRNFEGIFEIQNQSAVGNAEVRRAKLWSRSAGQTNLFSFAFSERLSV
ncbi:hypothetical protein KKC67_01395, partial [Patescibacteria group bacterium]|nr:hypothetical protein [Patescibacteria group bacterium]